MLLGKLDKDEFAQTLMQYAEKEGVGPLTYDRSAFVLRNRSSNTTTYLTNFYAEFRAAPPWKRHVVLVGIARNLGKVPTTADVPRHEALRILRPRIRPRAYHDLLELRVKVENMKGYHPMYRELGGGHLTLEVVLDRPGAIWSIVPAQLEDWGLTFEEAITKAGDNLLKKGVSEFRSPQRGLYVSDWRDNYDASRLHMSEVIGKLSVRGRPVAMVPGREKLIVTGEDDPEGLIAMATIAEEVIKEPRPLSGYAFRLDNGWVPFLPPKEHPAYQSMRRTVVTMVAQDYQTQQKMLVKHYEKTEPNLYVAGVMSLSPTIVANATTISTLGQNVDTLLPQTDLVAFASDPLGDKPAIHGMATWEDTRRVLGSLMEPQGYYLERYRIREFPSPHQLRLLGIRTE